MSENDVRCRDCASYRDNHPVKCRLWLKRANGSTVEKCPGFIDKSTFERCLREINFDGLRRKYGDLSIDMKEKEEV